MRIPLRSLPHRDPGRPEAAQMTLARLPVDAMLPPAAPPAVGERAAVLLRAVVQASTALVAHRDLHVALQAAVDAMGPLVAGVGLDRVYVFEYTADGARSRLVAEYAHPPTPRLCHGDPGWAEIDMPRDFPEILAAHRAGRTWTSRQADRRGRNAEMNAASGAGSDAIMPILVRDALWGCVGFDAVRSERVYSATELDALEGAATAIGAAVLRAEAEGASRASLESANLLLGAVTRFSVALNQRGAFATRCRQALEGLLDVPGVDRALIGRIVQRPDGGRDCLYLFEAVRPGLLRQTEQPWANPIRFESGPTIAAALERGEAFQYFPELDGDGGADAQERLGVRSNLLVPVVAGGEWWGVVAIDNCHSRAVWTPAQVELLRGLAEAVAGALAREDAEQQQLASERERAAEAERRRTALAESRVRALDATNAAMRRNAEALADVGQSDEVLHAYLREAASQSGAEDVALLQRVGPTECRLLLVWHGGRVVDAAAPEAVPFADALRALSRHDPIGHFARIAAGEIVWRLLDGAHDWLPDGAAYLRGAGTRAVWDVPFSVRGEVTGYLALSFRTPVEPSPETAAHVRALAAQVSIGLELRRLADAERVSAAARARAEQLQGANTALRVAADRMAEDGRVEPLLDHVLLEAAAQVGACGSALFLIEPASGAVALWRFASRGAFVSLEADARMAIWRQPVPPAEQAHCHEWLRNHGAPVRVDLAAEDELWALARPWHAAFGHCGMLALPLVAAGRAFGFVGLYFDGPDAPVGDGIGVAEALVQQAALALTLQELSEAARAVALARERALVAEALAAQRERERGALQLAIDAIARLDRIDDVLPEALRVAERIFGATGAAYFDQPDDGRIYLRLWCADGTVLAPDEVARHFPGHEDVMATLVAGFEVPLPYLNAPHRARLAPAVLDHAAGTAVPAFDRMALALRATYELNVPIVRDGLARGALVIYRDSRPYDEAELALADALGKQLALGAETARLARLAAGAAAAQARELAASAHAADLARTSALLQGAIGRLAEAEGPDVFLAHVMGAAATAVGARDAGLFVMDASQRRLRMTRFVVEGRPVDIAADPRFAAFGPGVPLDELGELWARLVDGDEVLVERPGAADSRAWPPGRAVHAALGHDVVLCLPLRVGPTVLGVLALGFTGPGAERPEQVALARAFANQAAIALEFMRLLAMAEAAAVIGERNRLAREIHDMLAQCLTGVIMQLQAAAELWEVGPATARACLERARELARDGLGEARRSVRALRDDERGPGLAHGLRELAERSTTDTRVEAALTVAGEVRELPAEVERQLLRIGQEAFTNALRHAGASRIGLRLVFGPGTVALSIEDDGAGFDVAGAVTAEGFGLIGMRQRAERIGAQLSVRSEPGRGTQVLASWAAGSAAA